MERGGGSGGWLVGGGIGVNDGGSVGRAGSWVMGAGTAQWIRRFRGGGSQPGEGA